MAKTLTEARITSRADRKRLASGLHWRGIDPEVHLGYRKGKRGGVWLVRWYLGGGYRQRKLATADDELAEGTLDYNGAVRAARDLVQNERLREKNAAAGPVLTVADAIETYASARDARDSARKGRPTSSDARSRLSRYVSGQTCRGRRQPVAAAPLARVALQELATRDLLEWRDGLPSSLKGTTKRRLINDLKAALNGSFAANRDRLPPSFTDVVKHGLRTLEDHAEAAEPVARENQILSDSDIGRIIRAARDIDDETGWDGDLFRLVVTLAATGARFSQVARLRVADLQPKASRLIMPASRKGRGAKGVGTPIPLGKDVLEALVPAITGRRATEPLLERRLSKQLPGTIRWEQVGRGPWQTASELARPWAAVRKRAGLPNAIPYSLRHSSIVRGIKANLPIRLVAALHDTSVAMIERHYGRYIADGLDELAARGVVPLVPPSGEDNVVRMTA
ncbi:MAG TPA: integrase [Sphingomicrobium sp.]|nr:integrase [Sphingomicrobium sp.]